MPSFGCLLETRVQETHCSGIINETFPGWSYFTNYDCHRLGRIWLILSDAVAVTPLYRSPQSITVWIKPVSGGKFLCSCVHASNFQRDRLLLWEELKYVRDNYGDGGTPWILIGDFNVSLSSSEHSQPSDYFGDQSGMREFQEFVTGFGVSDLDYRGPKFSWWNKHEQDPIGKKNSTWLW